MAGGPAARRLTNVPDEPALGGDPYDYADAFEVEMHPSDRRSCEQLARDGLERMPRPVLVVVRTALRRVLRLRLGPDLSPGHVLGWPIITSSDDLAHLESSSPLLRRAVIVVRRPTSTSATISTFLFHAHPSARLLWAIVGPVHRRVAPYLMVRAARDG